MNNLKWKSVPLEGFPVLQASESLGFIGLEECADYGLESKSSRPKKVISLTYNNTHIFR